MQNNQQQHAHGAGQQPAGQNVNQNQQQRQGAPANYNNMAGNLANAVHQGEQIQQAAGGPNAQFHAPAPNANAGGAQINAANQG